jgi:hypothetical protein
MALPLKLTAPGVSAERIQQALLLAEAVLEKAGVTPEEGVAGVGACEVWDIHDFAEDMTPSDEQYRAAAVLDEAQHVAMRCCYGDAVPPNGASLDVAS